MATQNKKLEELISILKKNDVRYFEQGDIKISFTEPKPVITEKKDLSKPKKTKEQEDEELLFHSAGRT